MEQRRGPRQDSVFEIIVSEVETGGFVGRVANVSEDGLHIVRQEPLPENTLLYLKVDLPAEFCGFTELTFHAQVRWCEPDEDPRQTGVGLQILDLNDDHKRVFRELMRLACFDH
jgi:hypothetical protein